MLNKVTSRTYLMSSSVVWALKYLFQGICHSNLTLDTSHLLVSQPLCFYLQLILILITVPASSLSNTEVTAHTSHSCRDNTPVTVAIVTYYLPRATVSSLTSLQTAGATLTRVPYPCYKCQQPYNQCANSETPGDWCPQAIDRTLFSIQRKTGAYIPATMTSQSEIHQQEVQFLVLSDISSLSPEITCSGHLYSYPSNIPNLFWNFPGLLN